MLLRAALAALLHTQLQPNTVLHTLSSSCSEPLTAGPFPPPKQQEDGLPIPDWHERVTTCYVLCDCFAYGALLQCLRYFSYTSAVRSDIAIFSRLCASSSPWGNS